MYIHAEVKRRARRKRRYNHSGDYGRKVPPVPIPNTEVKLSYAESTLRDTAWEDRSSPLLSCPSIFKTDRRAIFLFSIYINRGCSDAPAVFCRQYTAGRRASMGARIVTEKQAKQGMKLCEKSGTESKKVEKDREKLSKTIDKNSLE